MKQTKQNNDTRPTAHSRRLHHTNPKSFGFTPKTISRAAVAGCLAMGLATLPSLPAKADLLDPILDPVLGLVMDDEFSFNKSNEVIGAHHAYADGITGSGIRVAIADTGVFPSYARQLELKGQIKREQNFRDESVWTLWGLPLGQFSHGQAMGTVAIGKKNGWGGQGVAYGADGYSYRISAPNSGLAPKSPQHVADMMARFKADNISVMSGAWGWIATRHPSVHNVNWMQNAMMPFANEMANLNADGAYRGTALVFAAGNDATPNPSNLMALVPYWFPELQSTMLAVTGVDVTGWQSGDDTSGLERAYFASACGVAKDWCVAAPAMGLQMVWPNKAVAPLAGTSMATAATTGAIALIMEAFPEISAQDAIAIVLETATDIGAPGVDEIFGHGLVNVEAALQPVGDPTITMNGVTNSALGSVMETSSLLGSGFSAALNQTNLTFEDKYNRHFTMSLGQVARPRTEQISLTVPSVASFGPQLIDTPQRGVFLTAAGGTIWQGSDGTRLAIGTFADQAVVPAGALPFDHMEEGAWAGVLSLPQSKRGMFHLGAVENSGSLSVFGTYRYGLSDHVHLATGMMVEQNRLHGNQGSGLLAFDGHTATAFTGVSGQWLIGNDYLIEADAAAGYLRFDGQDRQITQGMQGLVASASLSLTQKSTLVDGDRLKLTLGLPTTMLNGQADLHLPYRGKMVDEKLSFTNKPAVEAKMVWAMRF